MIKLVMCVRRRADLSRAEFQDYWLNHHGPLFQKFAETYKAIRYIQSHTINTPLNDNVKKARGMSEEYDGIAEIWWESEKDFIEAISAPDGQEFRTIFLEDEAKFLDFTRSSAFFTDLCNKGFTPRIEGLSAPQATCSMRLDGFMSPQRRQT